MSFTWYFLILNKIRVSSERHEKGHVGGAGRPRGNQYSGHLLHNIKSMLASCGLPNTQPTNTCRDRHICAHTIGHTARFLNLH